uniref:Methionine aminopeptidase n=2 Tax=Lotharella globosa TaxID=91324 RepID=A0A7S3YVT8_9EUKA
MATLQCPKCLKLGLPSTYYCDKKCFTQAWKAHNQIHKEHARRLAFKPPSFAYTGKLRPHYVTPMRKVPAHIKKPDYAISGTPVSEMRDKDKVVILNEKQIEGLREACRVGREVLDLAGHMVKPGVTTEEIDVKVHQWCIERGAYPSPLNYHNFPKSCCTSPNEVICHGIPDARPLQEGDIVNIDITVYKNGFHGDLNETFLVGEVDEESKKLVRTTYESLMLAIRACKPDFFIRDFGKIISKHCNRKNYSVVRSYCGHGIGELFHCAPNVPHYSKNKAIGTCKPGMAFTIEPMINIKSWRDKTWPDNWTSVTADGKRSAQFEHTILVTETGCEVLTARTANSKPFWWEEQKEVKDKKTSK